MAQCPQCQSSIEITDSHHGTLFNCPHCQAVFFVGWDGVPEQPQTQATKSIHVPGATPTFEPQTSAVHENPAGDLIQPSFSQPQWEPDNNNMPISPGPETSAVEPASNNFADVVEYGNSPQLKSNITYDLTIQGIEIADTREKFKEAIQDSRFGWDAETILKQIQGGSVTLRDLSPAKASALVNRIKFLPIRISWRQNVLS